MKSMILAAAVLLTSTAGFAFEIHNISKFTINWDDRDSFQQTDGLGCPGEDNIVMLQIPGTPGKDFSVSGADAGCKLVFSASGADESGKAITLMIYKGQCASDNDENFTVVRSGFRQQAHITVDAGC